MAEMNLFVDCDRLAIVRNFVAQVGRDLGLDSRTIDDIKLAVDEACTNIVEHAYGGQGGQIEIEIKSIDGGVQVTIHDWGAAFDPQAVPSPDVTAPLEHRPLGGLGLYLMRQMMDRVDFQFDGEDGNTLTMVKRLEGEE
jgi:serine/threonine-protein kinase RsbW